jgi:hypothetical protein
VAVKTIAQQDVQVLHRIRRAWVAHRTALVGLLAEYGIALVTAVGDIYVRSLYRKNSKAAGNREESPCTLRHCAWLNGRLRPCPGHSGCADRWPRS